MQNGDLINSKLNIPYIIMTKWMKMKARMMAIPEEEFDQSSQVVNIRLIFKLLQMFLFHVHPYKTLAGIPTGKYAA